MQFDKQVLIAGIAALVFAVPAPLAAQLPGALKRVKDGAEKVLVDLPSLSDLMDDQPITTSFDDADYGVPFLDDYSPTRFDDLTAQKRGPNGEFIVTPGLYAYEARAYCLRAGTAGPGAGDGYLYAPLAGPATDAVQSVIRGAYRHPEISQRDVQMLLWAIIARARFEDLSPQLREVARRVLSPQQLATLNRSAIAAISDVAIGETIGGAPPGVRPLLEADAKLRNLFSAADATYEELERVAVPSGILEDDDQDLVHAGRWSLHPEGYFVRYFAHAYTHTRVEISVPERWDVERDTLGRIVALTSASGHRFETEYDDKVRPLRVPGDPTLRGYAFSRIRLVHPDPSAVAGIRTEEWKDQGWTFVSVDAKADVPAQGMAATGDSPTHGPSAGGALDGQVLRYYVGGQSARFDEWRERAENAQAAREQVRDFERRWERRTGRPTEQAIDDLTDIAHYEAGLEAATGADMTAKGDWIAEHLELVERAYAWATCSLAGACGDDGGNPEDETTIDPSRDTNVPANRKKQRGKQGLQAYRTG